MPPVTTESQPRDLDREYMELLDLIERSIDPQLAEELQRISLLNQRANGNSLELAVMEGTCYAGEE